MRFLSTLGSVGLVVTAILCACSSDKATSSSSSSSGGFSTSSSSTTGGSGVTSSTSSNGGASSTSGTPANSNVNVTNETMTFNGTDHTYILVVPKSAGATPLPLVLSLHGNPGTAVDQHNGLPFENISGDGAVIAYPQSTSNPDGWDQFDLPGDNTDMQWMPALIDEIAGKASIDKTKVLAFGYSGGAYFLNNMACKTSNIVGLFKAVAVDAGDPACFDVNGCNDQCIDCNGGPIPTLIMHGLNDQEMGPESGSVTAGCVKDQNGCGGDLEDVAPSPCQKYAGCPSTAPVEYCGIPNVGHEAWGDAMKTAWAWFQALP